MSNSRTGKALIFLILGLIALSRLKSPGTGDVGLWMDWIANAESRGLIRGYEANGADYPPLSSVLLWLAARTGRSLGASAFMALKVSLFVFLIGSAVAFWLWTKRAALASSVLAALTLNSVCLGYLDVYLAPTFLLALWALQRRDTLLFSCAFGLTCLVKWQPLILAPFLALYVLGPEPGESRPSRARTALELLLPAALLAALTVSIFGLEVLRAFGRAMTHKALSGNALNVNWIVTHLLHAFAPRTYGGLVKGYATYIETDTIGIALVSKLAFGAAYVACLVRFARSDSTFENLIVYSLTAYLAYFALNTGVHENHLFLAVILAAVLAWIDERHRTSFVLWALMANANLLLFCGIDGRDRPFSRVVGVDMAMPLALITVFLFALEFRAAMRAKPALPGGQTCHSGDPDAEDEHGG